MAICRLTAGMDQLERVQLDRDQLYRPRRALDRKGFFFVYKYQLVPRLVSGGTIRLWRYSTVGNRPKFPPYISYTFTGKLDLGDVHLAGVHLTGMYLSNVYLMRVSHRRATHRRASHGIGVHLTGICLMGVYLIGVICIS